MSAGCGVGVEGGIGCLCCRCLGRIRQAFFAAKFSGKLVDHPCAQSVYLFCCFVFWRIPITDAGTSGESFFLAVFPSQVPLSEEMTEEREKRLFYALNSGGLYYSFVERLKPRVQRVVRKRFSAVPANPVESEKFVAGLYAHLVEQAAVVLNERIR